AVVVVIEDSDTSGHGFGRVTLGGLAAVERKCDGLKAEVDRGLRRVGVYAGPREQGCGTKQQQRNAGQDQRASLHSHYSCFASGGLFCCWSRSISCFSRWASSLRPMAA